MLAGSTLGKTGMGALQGEAFIGNSYEIDKFSVGNCQRKVFGDMTCHIFLETLDHS